GNVDEILARAGIFQGVEPSAVSTLITQLQPVDFPRGHTVFAEGEPGDRLYIIVSGKVKIARRSPDGREQLLRVLARRLRRTNNNLADLIFTDVPGRVAKQLLALAQRFGTQEDGGLRVTHDLTQEEIAQLVGASRETVNKALTDFAHRGWIRLDVKSVLICDSERLTHRAR